ncbi:MAG TPA: exodeoxyribonuclease VII large subunit [Solirubrobacterales bacterium]|nr:exodeoxyribonuclease VII large subunit [Solirubrobacterales bacterium]
MDLPGPFPVGRYAKTLRDELRKRARVRLIGEVTSLRQTPKQAYFELRDGEGAVPCTIWADELERLKLPDGALRDGAEFVVAGGPDYFIGSAASSPSFSFRATHLRLAGEGDLLARLDGLRKQLRAEGLFELQKQLARPLLPRTIGVVTAESGAARRDLLAGLRRRGWAGTIVWAFAPVQDRRAAPAIAASIQELAARPEIEAIVVTRGGGSLVDLWAFCDETLCRTVAMLRVPVVSAVGHERDSTLIDDVAAVACSTPTHAAEAAVPLDCLAARSGLERSAASLQRAGEGAVGARARHLAALARGPGRALKRERIALNQKTREIRAASERGIAERSSFQRRIALVVLDRAARRAAGPEAKQRREALRRAEVAFRAHDPERTLERGYALAEDAAGEPVTSAAAAVAAGRVRLRFADGRVGAEIESDGGGHERGA